ncbi:MAG: PilZ domain-containing protein [Myxococcota bacterium]
MARSVSALLIGEEGEIDRVQRLLDRLEVSYDRVKQPKPAETLAAPEKLLVVSGQSLPRLPKLVVPEGNAHRRVCIHGQDFLPLRERLRERGFHYLVQSALDETSLRVFIGQLLHAGSVHRHATRLPLGGPVEFRSARVSGTARLGDLSCESCRVLGAEGLSVGDAVTVVLPAALGGGSARPLPGPVIRARADERAGEGRGHSAVVRFSVLEPDAAERLGRLTRGELIGTRVTPLAASPPETALPQEPVAHAPGPAPAASAEPEIRSPAAEPPPEAPRDRRREVRHPYTGRVEMMELPSDAEGVLGRDLSLDGVCVDGSHRLKPGMKVTLALYGGHRASPVVVDAEAIRVTEREAALVFARLSGDQQDALATLIAEQPAVETLAPRTGSRVLATRILKRD